MLTFPPEVLPRVPETPKVRCRRCEEPHPHTERWFCWFPGGHLGDLCRKCAREMGQLARGKR